MKKKQFFMGSILTPLIMGGIIISVSVIVCLGNPEFSTVLFFSLLSVFVILSLINFAIADEKGITFFSFLFIPARYEYSEIVTKISLKSFQGKSTSGFLILLLKNGKRKILKLGLYPAETQEKIQDLILSNIITDNSWYQDRNRLVLWLKSARNYTVARYFFIFIIFILIGLFLQVKPRLWDWKAKNWKKTTAVILKNHYEKLSDSEQVYHFRYQYTVDGKNYTGNKIIGDTERLGTHWEPGTKMYCIVNPDNPEDAALLVKIRTDWIMRAGGYLLFLLGIPFFFLGMRPLCKKINIPAELKDYLAKIEPEKQQELAKLVCGECKISVGKISGGYQKIAKRYGCFPPAHSLAALLIQLLSVVIFTILGIKVMPHFLLVVLMIFTFIWKTIFPRGAVFDHEEKKIYWSRFFNLKSVPGKIKKNEVLNETDLIAVGLTIGKDYSLMLSVVRKDGIYIPVAKAGIRKMEQLLSDSVKLSESIGTLPIIVI